VRETETTAPGGTTHDRPRLSPLASILCRTETGRRLAATHQAQARPLLQAAEGAGADHPAIRRRPPHYYGSAGKFAPRLILLDEAFVASIPICAASAWACCTNFDLDFVMTSEREWGCYATLPGLAIYQLSARAGVDAVWTSRWSGIGRERLQANGAQDGERYRQGPGGPPKSLWSGVFPTRSAGNSDMIHDPDRLQQALGKATLARLIQGIAGASALRPIAWRPL